MIKTYKGSCGCKKVSYEVKAEKVAWIGHCHCGQCQKMHGAAYATWVGFYCESYKINDSEKHFRIFTGEKAERGFCSYCGSNLSFRYHDKNNEFYHDDAILFSRASLDSEISELPTEHIYWENKQVWYSVGDDLPKRKTTSEGDILS